MPLFSQHALSERGGYLLVQRFGTMTQMFGHCGLGGTAQLDAECQQCLCAQWQIAAFTSAEPMWCSAAKFAEFTLRPHDVQLSAILKYLIDV